MKPWQIVIVVLALGATVWSLARTMLGDDGMNFPDRWVFVDVETGRLYAVSTDERVVIPGRSPESGNRSLFPVSEGDDGTWTINERFLEGAASNEHRSDNAPIDWETGRIDASGEPEFIRYSTR